ncbi:MAG TPA: 3-dehydroquinate synthase [Gammaproteobacteria bacterium]|nr:3-dehydroquinate synthase [Gammaproteobacteria bacterium]
MKSLSVKLGSRSYPIHIGTGLLGQRELFEPHCQHGPVCIVTDDKVAPLYLETLQRTLADSRLHSMTLPNGEQNKHWQTLDRIFTFLLKNELGRDTTLIALGGGVVGDLTGFAAACYQRGIRYLQVPTTLLAQVDSSVGGKTAINHRYGKNMLGAFHQPQAVIADTGTLASLDARDFSAGLAEAIKYGIMADADFFLWLETNIQALLARDSELLNYAIYRSCEIKAEVVAADERETGQRELLNLGHTFGHAIEVGMGYGEWLHGEAVAAGITMAAALSVRLGWLTAAEYRRISRLLERAGLPVKAPDTLAPADFMQHMQRDKKVRDGRLRLVLPRGIGRAVVSDDFAPAALADTLAGKPL